MINFRQAFRAYIEIIQTCEIESMTEGENVCVHLRGNICGDILVFISPKNPVPDGGDLISLLVADTKLQQRLQVGFKTFRQKISGLVLLPRIIVWVINIGLSAYFLSKYFQQIQASVTQNDLSSSLWNLLPLLIFTIITVFFGKTLGFVILKPVVRITTWIFRTKRQIRSRKLSIIKPTG